MLAQRSAFDHRALALIDELVGMGPISKSEMAQLLELLAGADRGLVVAKVRDAVL